MSLEDENIELEILKFKVLYENKGLMLSPEAQIHALSLSAGAKSKLLEETIKMADSVEAKFTAIPLLFWLVSPNNDLKDTIWKLLASLFEDLLIHRKNEMLLALIDLRPRILEIFGAELLQQLDYSLRTLHPRWPVLPIQNSNEIPPPSPKTPAPDIGRPEKRLQGLPDIKPYMQLLNENAELRARNRFLESQLKDEEERAECGICFGRGMEWVLGCGHHYCSKCINVIQKCSFCQYPEVGNKIKIYRS